MESANIVPKEESVEAEAPGETAAENVQVKQEVTSSPSPTNTKGLHAEVKERKKPVAAAKAKKGKKKKQIRDMNAPKQALSGYFRFLNDNRDRVRTQNQGASFSDITRILAGEWTHLPAPEKQKYLDAAEADKERYQKEMEEYKRSEAYKVMMKKKKKQGVKSKHPFGQVNEDAGSEPPPKKTGVIGFPGFDIPIFTEEFLDHNKAQETELRKLRRVVAEYEEQNAILQRHIEQLTGAIEQLESEVNEKKQNATQVQQYLSSLRTNLVSAFGSIRLPGSNELPMMDSIDGYMIRLQNLLSSSQQHQDLAKEMTLEAIKYKDGKLEILNQLALPEKSEYISIQSVEDAWDAIHSMKVRGAPAIAIVGCLGLLVEVLQKDFTSIDEAIKWVKESLDHLVAARPTAVNMSKAASHLRTAVQQWEFKSVQNWKARLQMEIEGMLEKDLDDNKQIGEHGADEILENFLPSEGKVSILTHCNTGSLATSGYGTALGVIRSLFSRGKIDRVYCTETRPYNQGARLTAYELVHDGIPASLICDSMAGALLAQGKVTAIITGADRVTANGDTANKIGTYQLAVLARHHNIPFYIAAPFTSIDATIPDGSHIPIEQRPAAELTHIKGSHIAAPGIEVWNPAFDVTPADLITGIITEQGVFSPHSLPL